MMLASWQTKNSKVVYENPWMIVHEDQVVMPNGKDGLYGYIDSKSDSVYVVPVDNEGNTYLVQQERYTTKTKTWECVAGRMDNDDAETAAYRELTEETGLEAKQLEKLCTVQVANGISTFTSTFYLATELTIVREDLDPEDGILAVKKVPLASIPERIFSGEIVCSQSIAAFLAAASYLRQEK